MPQNPLPLHFRLTQKTGSRHIDDLGHVNNVIFLEWVQLISAAHWKNNASREMQEKYVWVVLRHEIDYKKPAFAGDELILHTEVLRFEGVRSIRKVLIMRDEQILVSALTHWCLLDRNNGRPLRVPEAIIKLFIP